MGKLLKNIKNRIQFAPFTISSRALQRFRICFGFCILYDLIQHFSDVPLFYSDAGMMPRENAIHLISYLSNSIYFWVGSPAAVTGFYLLHILFAFLFFAGIGMPVTTLILWIFQFSLKFRNIPMVDSGDDLSILLLFISIFLPLVKEDRASTLQKKWTYLTRSPLWYFVFLMQGLYVYFFSSLFKNDYSWNKTFTASEMALRLDFMSTAFGKYLLDYPSLLKCLTAFTFYLEMFGPCIFLAFAFMKNKFSIRVRQGVCIAFIAFHLGLSATMRLGVFPYYAIVFWMTVFPLESEKNETAAKSPRPPFWVTLTRLPSHAYALLILTSLTWWNLQQVDPKNKIPAWMDKFIFANAITQNWGMFSPFPQTNNIHVAVEGVSPEYGRFDLVKESEWFETRHRLKYWMNLNSRNKAYIIPFAQYLCEQKHVTQVDFIALNEVYNRETFATTPSKETIINYSCLPSSQK